MVQPCLPSGAVDAVSRARQHEEVARSEGDLRIYWEET